MFYKLESLRGFAACMVILYHSPYTLFQTGTSFINNSYLFVDLFFILSGFVIQHAYGDKIRHGFKFSDFILLRWARVYPLHVFMLLAFAAFVGAKIVLHYYTGLGGAQEFDRNNAHAALMHLLLLHSLWQPYLTWNEPSWSISAEFYTYITFFLFIRWLDIRYTPRYFPVVLSAGLYLWLLTRVQPDLNISYDYGFLRCIAGFYLGVFLHRYREAVLARIPHIQLAEIGALLLTVVAVSLAGEGPRYQWLTILSFASLLLVYAHPKSGLLGRLLLLSPVLNLGKWSYSIYMTHILIVFVMVQLTTVLLRTHYSEIHGGLALLLNSLIFIITLTISRLTFTHIEDRFRNMVSRKLKHKRSH